MTGSTPTGAPLRVRVLTRDGCHLCVEALETVRQVCAEFGCGFEEVDVDSDPQLRAAYTDHVPVTFVDGARHDFWRVDADRLRGALAGH